MIKLRVKGTKSWLDPRSEHALSANLCRRLTARCRGRRGVFVTLTYQRDEWDDARDLYRSASEQQHVPLFLRKVSRFLGVKLTGKWFCKLEFQKGGWVHWHIIILDVTKIPHADLQRMWGHGHVWINRLSPRRIRYCTKYVCKGGSVPTWLYAEPPKAVKIIRCSPGFWGNDPKEKADPDPEWRPARLPFWKTIGQRIEESGQQLVATDGDGNFRRSSGDLGLTLARLIAAGHSVLGTRDGWIVVDCDLDDVERAAQPACVAEVHQHSARRGLPPLHLTDPPNPDAVGVAPWLHGLLCDLLDVRHVGSGVLA